MYDIAWSKRALKSLSRIAHRDAQRIYLSAQALRKWPECRNVVKLTNHDYSYRLRVGSYRIFFDVDKIISIIVIEEVKKRNERTY